MTILRRENVEEDIAPASVDRAVWKRGSKEQIERWRGSKGQVGILWDGVVAKNDGENTWEDAKTR